MYLEYYGLEQAPFSITPDPHYVFLSEHHRDALAHLLYGIRQGGGGGFVQLTGEVGTGKTTLSRLLLSQLPENTQAALVLNPRLEPLELLETICEELRIPLDGATAPPAASAKTSAAARKRKPTNAKRSGKALFDALSAYLLDAYAKGDRVVLIIDEAQNLSADALEQVRLLTNLETETQKLLQIILIGQPELRDALARPDLRQLAQRITARYHLSPLDEMETGDYLRHRMTAAGAARFPFAPGAVRRIYRRSGGVPRLINVIAERALLGGYARDLLTIDAATVERAADEALMPAAAASAYARAHRAALRNAAILTLLVGGIVAWLSWAARDDADDLKMAGQGPARTGAVTARTNDSAAVRAPTATNAAPPTTDDIPKLDATVVAALAANAPDRGSAAFRALRALWAAPAALDAIAPETCPEFPVPGWRCLRAQATLDRLHALNRPVLLRLHHGDGHGWVLLAGIDARYARLEQQGQRFDLDRVSLSSVWRGEYLALWPAQADLEPAIAHADASAMAWLRQRLVRDANAAGLAISADTATAIRAFQARHGLRNDGIVGPETLFALTGHDPGPRLQTTER
ncbi:MAG: hypothetical protein E6Q88_01945 [Lysobacteraceae bacterium]|nr:MAG: hypothetical protein E6Q88_01945 [Xanthomonadaceae bacterium]